MATHVWFIVLVGMIFPQQEKPIVGAARPDFPAFHRSGSQYTQLGTNVWLEKSVHGRRVLVLATICRRDVPLEEFLCLKNTKEHESIITADLVPKVFHAALLAAGAISGTVARFDGQGFHPPTGDKLEITVEWKHDGKVRTAKAQDWIRDYKTKKAIEYEFVFAGSQEVKHPITGEPFYLGNEGDLISVANFVSSIVDLAIESTTNDSDRLFEAFTERIPAVDTPVVIILKPKPRPNSKSAPANSQP